MRSAFKISVTTVSFRTVHQAILRESLVTGGQQPRQVIKLNVTSIAGRYSRTSTPPCAAVR